ncbi:alpha/beta hydrolase [Saccharopolyspora taberi]|uniref:Alpha/beta hydrolase n=1 Tax=Saccharopolyspora taberi TaxID=60895 RepID=A0ABN3VF07_9PSEU
MRVRVGGIELFFDVVGARLVPDGAVMRERPTIVCLHGGPGLDHSSLRPDFDALAGDGQVVYLDQRGHGRSDRSTPDRWSLAQWADDLREFCERLGIERPVVLGTSFGGYVAMEYAVRHADHPSKLVLVSTSGRGTGDRGRLERMFEAFERVGGAEAREVTRRLFAERTAEALADYRRVCGPLYSRRAPDPDASKRTIANEDVLPYFERPTGEGALFDIRPRLGEVRCPTLVVGGHDDPITPIAEQRDIAEAIPANLVRLEEFPDCGHGVIRDDPEKFVRVVSEFVAG